MIAESRERALAKRAQVTTPGKELQPLMIGDSMQIQNQAGNYPNKWYSTGVIAEILPNRQYHVVLDGSRRISLRNRRFLKKISPICRRNVDHTQDAVPPMSQLQPAPATSPPISPAPVRTLEPMEPQVLPLPADSTYVDSPQNDMAPEFVGAPAPPSPPASTDTHLGWSTREKAPRLLFSAKLKGKSHE